VARHGTRPMPQSDGGAVLQAARRRSCDQPLARRRDSSQSQSGLVSAPRRPHAWQTKRGSSSDSRVSSGHRSALILTACAQW